MLGEGQEPDGEGLLERPTEQPEEGLGEGLGVGEGLGCDEMLVELLLTNRNTCNETLVSFNYRLGLTIDWA